MSDDEIVKEVNVKIDTKNVEKLIEQLKEKDLENKQLSEQLEEEKTIKEDYESKLKIVAEKALEQKKKELNAPDWINDPESLMKWAESEGKIEKGGKGSLSLRPEDLSRENSQYSEGYDSIEDMINDLRAKGDTETIEKLYRKYLPFIKNNRIEYKDPFEPNPETGEPESCVKKHIREMNEKLRKKAKGE